MRQGSVLPLALSMFVVLAIAPALLSAHEGTPMADSNPDANSELVRRFLEASNDRDPGAYDEFIALDLIDHDALPGLPPGRAGFEAADAALFAAFPDWQANVEDLIAAGDKVVVRTIEAGTHQGEFLGIPPTGQQVTLEAIVIYRIDDGRIVERWAEMDTLGFLQQLGVIPPFGPPATGEEATPAS